ncbi:DUF2911 domain-containing protein [Aliifodinibius sp. S!AR15-10]|uniref:DUF2911 domain-containing protein n=1 Tax=Aliifodinibius sp. S!AR15-10 TaxID=2950437 RepID=UPI0028658669|nr:DUF2911 domain-containing protein [Aliifodinibius sp. S!AR15-10]MDR8392893.1 DUF2911 domain-containing protein [Aliifodinibius sp. S!AR15-10]
MKLTHFLSAATLSLALVFLVTQFAVGQDRATNETRVSPNASVSQTIGTTQVTITYGRPSVNDRQVFGGLEPFGEVWRTGANEATTITFSDDVMIEGEPLEAGTYGLFTIPSKDQQWTVIFNNVAQQWGAFDYDSGEDALRVEVTPEEGSHMEQLMFYFEDVSENSGTAIVHWSDVKVPFTIEPAS